MTLPMVRRRKWAVSPLASLDLAPGALATRDFQGIIQGNLQVPFPEYDARRTEAENEAVVDEALGTIEALMRDVCRRHNFQSSGHTFIIRGTCADCNRTRVSRRLLDLV